MRYSGGTVGGLRKVTAPVNDTPQPNEEDLDRAVIAWRRLAPAKYKQLISAQ